jgi:hypothetical protein
MEDPDPDPASNIAPTGNVPPATLLIEYVGVVEMRFVVPENLRFLLLSRLLLEILLVVRVPTAAWRTKQYSRLNVFEALCQEIVTATIGVEAASDHLVYMMASTFVVVTADGSLI